MDLSLAEVIDRYPGMCLAKPEDNDEILRFFDAFPMHGEGLRVGYERGPDFFEFLKMGSPRFFVFLVRFKGTLRGLGTLTLRPGMCEGQKSWVGYLGDLRILAEPRAAITWRRFYEGLMTCAPNVREFEGCDHFLTSVIDQNQAAIRALVEQTRFDFRYAPASRYAMVNVSARWPVPIPPAACEVRRATAADEDGLRRFLRACNDARPMGWCFDGRADDQLSWRLAQWKGLGWQNVFLALSGGRIVGCTAVWAPDSAKRVILEKVPRSYKVYFKLLGPLGGRAPHEGGQLKVRYLTTLFLDESLPIDERRAIFSTLVERIWRDLRGEIFHSLSFCDFAAAPLLPALKRFVTFTTPMTLYRVGARGWPAGWDSAPSSPLSPGFEMALV